MNTIKLEIDDQGNPVDDNPADLPDAHALCRFLAEYAVELFGSGSTCIRLAKNMKRIARALGAEVEYSILPRHIHITVDSHGVTETAVVAIRQMPISYARITDLSRLSWQMADGIIDFNTARHLLPKIYKSRAVNQWTLVLLVAIANASFCRLFMGDWVAMLSVFTATFTGFLLKLWLQSLRWDPRGVVFACAFVSTLIASGATSLHSGSTPEVAVATCVLYLVPGIPFINSFCDLLDRHYLCAFGRFMNAAILLCCMSLGMLAGLSVMSLDLFSYLN